MRRYNKSLNKNILIFFFVTNLIGCVGNNGIEEKTVCGSGCKIWVALNCPTYPIICMDSKNTVNTFSIRQDGEIYKPILSDFVYIFYQGEWRIYRNSLYINDIKIDKSNVFSDSIFVGYEGVYLKDITDKFVIKNCDCDNLSARFKGGGVDSLHHLLQYGEE
jgi:hypothetical protein